MELRERALATHPMKPRYLRYPLPRLVRLGMGTRIRVRVVEGKELTRLNAGDPHGAGCWDVDTNTIYILDTLTKRQKWHCYFHELVHAVNDVGLNAVEGGI